MNLSDIDIRVVKTPQSNPETAAAVLAQFMADIVSLDDAYISHGEYFHGLSPDGKSWSEDLAELYRTEFHMILKSAAQENLILTAHAGEDNLLIGVAVTSFRQNGHEIYWVIEDMAVAPDMRRRGVGQAFIDQVATLAREAGAKRLFLESGVDNHDAHRLFENAGFHPFSKVFTREL